MKNIHVASRRKKIATLEKEFPGAVIIDVTSKAEGNWVKFSPFYPHKVDGKPSIPVPFCAPAKSFSVEGIWQGLKTFEGNARNPGPIGIDLASFRNDKMKNIKRTVRRFGTPSGHQAGPLRTDGKLGYITARLQIFLPAYLYLLENFVEAELAELKEILNLKDVVLLDYETNCDVYNTKKPLSHAGLIKHYLDGNWPS